MKDGYKQGVAMYKSAQGVHAGPNGPAFVFGRPNLDYQGADLSGVISEELSFNPMNDFTRKDLQYGSFGSLDEEAEKMRRDDVSREFLRFAFEENEMDLDDLLNLREDEEDELMAEFVNSRDDTVDDDFARLKQERKTNRFADGVASLSKAMSHEVDHLFTKEHALEVADTSEGKPWHATSGIFNLKKAYCDDVVNGNFKGSFEKFMGSNNALQFVTNQRREDQEKIGELVSSWHNDVVGSDPYNHSDLLIAEYDDTWPENRGRENENGNLKSISSRWLADYNGSMAESIDWGRDEHGDEIRLEKQEYLKRKDGSLEVALSLSNGEQRSMVLRPMNVKEHYVTFGKVEDTPLFERLHDAGDKVRISDLFENLQSVGEVEEIADALRELEPNADGVFFETLRDGIRNRSNPKKRNTSLAIIDAYSEKYGSDNLYNKVAKSILEEEERARSRTSWNLGY